MEDVDLWDRLPRKLNMAKGLSIVWFKRDLRTDDHLPLVMAAQKGPTVPLYVVEPEYWQLPDTSDRQWSFVRECLYELDVSLRDLGVPLIIRTGDAVEILDNLNQRFGVETLLSHEETGNAWTFTRDKRVAKWSKQNKITWAQYPQFGVVRRLKKRDGWASNWDDWMALPTVKPPAEFETGPDLTSDPIPPGDLLGLSADPCTDRQKGGRAAGLRTLDEFLQNRGHAYHKKMSSPNSAFESCSRLSPYLAYGALSMREVVQATRIRVGEARQAKLSRPGSWGPALRAFSARLHWHCHFIQKLEDDPRFEYTNVHSGFDGMRNETEVNEERLNAWTTGQTGYPFVDACMRALNQTGWINFRMRAMLTSFASYQLWLHWRQTGLCLARKFTDYESGIHWNQVQMQSGTTGINTVRIYNPVKQSLDQDSDGNFIRRWVPELANVSSEFIHEPWTLTAMEQKMAQCIIGKDYPERIVDHLEAARSAKASIFERRKSVGFQKEAHQIQEKHGSRKTSGRPSPRVKKYKDAI